MGLYGSQYDYHLPIMLCIHRSHPYGRDGYYRRIEIRHWILIDIS